MFDAVAPLYDRLNAVLSLGIDQSWRRATRTALDLRPGERVLDLAAGTGTSAAPLAATGAFVVAVDRSAGMVRLGRRRFPNLTFVGADAERLPFADASFDAATISFGLRNVQHPLIALRELCRVVRPGGRLVICEFSTPAHPGLRAIYRVWLHTVVPRLAHLGNAPDGYRYLAESIAAWPDQTGVAAMAVRAGWTDVAYRNLSGGIVALHRAWHPLDGPA